MAASIYQWHPFADRIDPDAEVKNEKEVKEGEKLLRSERYFGKVSRSFKLAQDVNDSKAAARYNDGVLELVLPKRSNGGCKRLNID